jgi:hypothetical protein
VDGPGEIDNLELGILQEVRKDAVCTLIFKIHTSAAIRACHRMGIPTMYIFQRTLGFAITTKIKGRDHLCQHKHSIDSEPEIVIVQSRNDGLDSVRMLYWRKKKRSPSESGIIRKVHAPPRSHTAIHSWPH